MNFFLRRKGDVSVSYIIAVVVAVLAVVIGLMSVGLLKTPILLAKYLPDFKTEAPEGTSIVGVNLKTNELRYFTGERWRTIKDSNDFFVLDKYEFVPNDLKREIEDFYFDTLRKPVRLSIDINHWRMGGAHLDNRNIAIFFKTKEGFISSGLEEFYSIDYFDNPKFVSSVIVSRESHIYTPHFSDLEIQRKPIVNDATTWRDSILQGNKCEKFFYFSGLKENKQISDNKYTVRKVDNYLFVDLGKPVISGKDEKWANDDCFGVENYADDGARDVAKFSIHVAFYDSTVGRRIAFIYTPGKGWASSDSSYTTGILLWKKTVQKYEFPASYSFIDGLYTIISKGHKEISSFEAGYSESGDGSTTLLKIDKIGADYIKELDKILYDILDKYNLHVISNE